MRVTEVTVVIAVVAALLAVDDAVEVSESFVVTTEVTLVAETDCVHTQLPLLEVRKFLDLHRR